MKKMCIGSRHQYHSSPLGACCEVRFSTDLQRHNAASSNLLYQHPLHKYCICKAWTPASLTNNHVCPVSGSHYSFSLVHCLANQLYCLIVATNLPHSFLEIGTSATISSDTISLSNLVKNSSATSPKHDYTSADTSARTTADSHTQNIFPVCIYKIYKEYQYCFSCSSGW